MSYDEPVSITCTISGGTQPVDVIWMLNRVPIEPNFDIVTEKRGKHINVLIIESVKAKHAGNYTCLAQNAAGIVEHTSQLIVIGLKAFRFGSLFMFFI